MRSIKTLIAGLAVAMLLSTGAFAGSDLNEVGAMLVFPTIVADDDMFVMGEHGGNKIETFVTITNAGAAEVYAHVSYINGEDRHYDDACYECDFEIPLSGNDTETLVITSIDGGTRIESEDSDLELSCDWDYGMIVVTLEDGMGATLTDNVLLGEEVIVDYDAGSALSIPAVSFQGKDGGDGNREYAMDDNEYGKMPRIVAADFLAPRDGRHHESGDYGKGTASLSLFTLGFERQFKPLVDCSVIGFDAEEHPFSASFQFGCWAFIDLCDISPEFCFPNLGLYSADWEGSDSHGWLQLNCRVDSDDDGEWEANGGVHGAIVQYQEGGSVLPAATRGGHHSTRFDNDAAWGRLLYQSVTTGDAVTLVLEGPPGGMF